jgi:hypothetical protein
MTTIPIERICALIALTSLGFGSLYFIKEDAPNIIINIIVGIVGFITGNASIKRKIKENENLQ